VTFAADVEGKFTGKRVLVTGGTRGIGRAAALAFAQAGAQVAVTYAGDEDSAARVRRQLADSAADALVLKADGGQKDQVTRMLGAIFERWGGVDILVNNAGIHRDRLLLFMNEQDWDAVLQTNLRATFLCSQGVLKAMIAQRWGRIITLASPSGITGRAGQTNYAASKGGIIAFTKSLAREVARIGITVNAVSPGVIRTSLTEKLDEHVLDDLKKQIPADRFGEPGEIAAAILFLASEAAGYITGQVLAVDGGLT
jgi:3-oxoacyl-[acyl-carrier protein] reductase